MPSRDLVPAATSAGMTAAPQGTHGGTAVTLDEALTRARANEPTFAAAVAASQTAALDRSIARAALLPSVVYHNQYLYTQPNGATNAAGSTGTQPAPRFIANNTVHEYVSQAVVTETLGLTQTTALSRASAAAAVAAAELEISRRGLVQTVVNLFYSSTTSQRKLQIQQRALQEANDFVKQTQQREALREAAHADVLKAQLTAQQRERDLADAQLAIAKARLDLGVLLFPDPRAPYIVTLPTNAPLPTRAAVEAAANTNNPELRSALATLKERNLGVFSARAGYLPDLVLNYNYGIDAPQFATRGPDSTTNLGYAASATLDIPIWDWFATQNKVKQARIQRDLAKVLLTSTQRSLIAHLEEFYAEAELSNAQLASLDLTVQTAAESLRLTRLRYSNGESTVLEVVDAQNTLTTAELAQADGVVRYQLALANLQMLTGTI
jgi:outer membrane protein